MLILIAGLAGTGKSTLAEKLGKKLGIPVIHASGVLKQVAEQKEKVDLKKTEKGTGFWESHAGSKVMEKRLEDDSLDIAVDKALLQIIEKENDLILDSWTMPYLSKKGIKIWLKASTAARAERTARRNSMPEKEAREKILQKDRDTIKIFKRIYGFELGKGLEKFDLVIDNTSLSSEQTARKVLDFLHEKKVF